MGLLSIGVNKKLEENGLRPLIPSRDLLGVADLIEEAFQDDMDKAGKSALKEMRQLGRIQILLKVLDFFSPDVNTYLNGFVWVEDGTIVGNTTISRGANNRKRWFISNVAVAKTHRGQGISRHMMDAALIFVKEMRGQKVSLQVKEGNEPAIHLYRSLGFRHISTSMQFSLEKIEAIKPIMLPENLKIRARRFNYAETQSVFQLALATQPAIVQQERPLQLRNFQLGADFQVDNIFRMFLGAGQKQQLVIEEKATGELVATLEITPVLWRGNHKLSFSVHPKWQGKVEDALISYALRYLEKIPPRKIIVQHQKEHEAAVDALTAAGFSIERSLMWMTLSV